MRRLLPWALPAALLLEPIRSTLTYGQINSLLMALVAFDCLTRAPRWPRGILVGIAAAVKLTPAVFLLFFLLRRDLRSAARAGLSFAACTGAGFALAPDDSLRYWTQNAYQPTRIGGIAYAANQSILGTLARRGRGHPADLALAGPVPARRGPRGHPHAPRSQGQPGHVRPSAERRSRVADLAHILVTPLGLGGARAAHLPQHHQPEPPTAADVRDSGPAHLRDSTALAAPLRGGRELHWSWWQQAVGDSYALTGLAALTHAAIKKLLPRPKRRDPGTAGTLAAPHDQELGPVPSQTRDDASVPART